MAKRTLAQQYHDNPVGFTLLAPFKATAATAKGLVRGGRWATRKVNQQRQKAQQQKRKVTK